MNLEERIQAGKDGKYQGLNNGLGRINNFIFGTQRKTISLIGGQSGCFKSTLLDFIVQKTIKDAQDKGITLNLFYNSFEIDKLSKQCNWLSVQIFMKYGVIIPPETIKGLGFNRLTKEEEKLVDQEIPEMEKLFNNIHWNFKQENPTGLYHQVWQFMSKRGKFIEESYKDVNNLLQMKKVGFILDNPGEYNLMVTDHLYLCKKERGYNTKENIDKLSEYQVETKNMFGISYINLQQFNQGLSSVDRQKYKGLDISPQQSDFRDTTNPYTDSDVCIGLMCPWKLDLDNCLDYDISKLGQNMIMFKVIKNRLSKDNIAIGLHVNPKSGTFVELPQAKSMTTEDYIKYSK